VQLRAALTTTRNPWKDARMTRGLASADAPVGYPMVNVRDIESGKSRAAREPKRAAKQLQVVSRRGLTDPD